MLILFFSIFAKKIEVKATATAVPWFSRNSIALPDNKVQSALVERGSLRTSLCKNQTSWEMRIFNPPSNLHAIRHSVVIHKNALFRGCSTFVAMVTTVAFIQKRRKKE